MAAVMALLSLVARLAAQWYAPATEYHDPVQRVFPVELARVLAARENAAGAKIAEITVEVNNETDGRTAWRLRWFTAEREMWREVELTYGAEVLLSGPGFYREVRKQMLVQPWAETAETTATGAAATEKGARFDDASYWTELEPQVVARVAALRRALELGTDANRERLAGRLIVAAVPGVAGLVSLDTTLAARGAAYLAIAERHENVDAAADRRWAPVLWVARRSRAAQTLWTAGPAAARPASWWGEVFEARQPNEIFLRAAQLPTLARQAPLLAYAARMKNQPELLAAALVEVAGASNTGRGELAQCYDYAPWIWKNASSGPAAAMNGAWAADARRDWLAALDALYSPQMTSKERPRYTSTGAVKPESPAEPASPPDAALESFESDSYEVNKSGPLKAQPLAPVAIATEADLRAHGFEISGLTVGARYWYLARTASETVATRYLKEAERPMTGFGCFSAGRPAGRGISVFTAREARRMERIEGFGDRLMRVALPAESDDDRGGLRGRPVRFDEYTRAGEVIRAGWLMDERAISALKVFGKFQQIAPYLAFVQRLRDEGGPLLDRALAEEFLDAKYGGSGLRRSGMKNISGAPGVLMASRGWLDRATRAQELLTGLSEGDPAQVHLWELDNSDATALEQAREFERRLWIEPTDEIAEQTARKYFATGAYASGRRVIREYTPHSLSGPSFVASLATHRLTIALLEQDRALADELIRTRGGARSRNLAVEVVHAGAVGDRAAFERLVDEYQKRWPDPDPRHAHNVLRDFLPLWPALADPAHADHGRALDHFNECGDWAALQWFLAEQFNLPAEERARFFGNESAMRERRVMVAFVQEDKPGFADAYNEFIHSPDFPKTALTSVVILQHLRMKMFGGFVTEDVVPKRAEPVRSLLEQLREARVKAKG